MNESIRYFISQIRQSERMAGHWERNRIEAMSSARRADSPNMRPHFVNHARMANRWMVMHLRVATDLQNRIINELKKD